MKKALIFLLVILTIFTLAGCRKDNADNDDKITFKIVNIYSGMGGTQKDNLLQSTYSYTLLIESVYNSNDIKEIKITPGEKIRNKILNETPPEIKSQANLLEIQGSITFDTDGLSKEEIMELEPFVKNITFTLTDSTNYTLPFTTSNIFR